MHPTSFKTRFIPSMRQVHAGVGVGVGDRNLVLDRKYAQFIVQYTCILDEYLKMQTSLEQDYLRKRVVHVLCNNTFFMFELITCTCR